MAQGNIYNEIENINLDNLFKPEVSKSAKSSANGADVVESLGDSLYEKSMECPVCYALFKTKTTRPSKLRYVSSEIDLKPIYTPIQPAYYDVIICGACGYAAISSTFGKITSKQAEKITANITPKFKAKVYPEIYDAQTALERYKLALLSSIHKGGKPGEKAYICLKIGWIYRDLADEPNETNYLKAAYEGFQVAYGVDSFPICGLDELTLTYILAVFAKKFGNDSEAMRFLGKVILAKTPNARLKQKAIDLKQSFKSQ